MQHEDICPSDLFGRIEAAMRMRPVFLISMPVMTAANGAALHRAHASAITIISSEPPYAGMARVISVHASVVPAGMSTCCWPEVDAAHVLTCWESDIDEVVADAVSAIPEIDRPTSAVVVVCAVRCDEEPHVTPCIITIVPGQGAEA